jgi:hypothetical protein
MDKMEAHVIVSALIEAEKIVRKEMQIALDCQENGLLQDLLHISDSLNEIILKLHKRF